MFTSGGCLPALPRRALRALVICFFIATLGLLGLRQLRSDAFIVARLPAETDKLPIFASRPYIKVIQDEDKDTWPYRVFKSSLRMPPNITISVNKGALAEGYLFLDPKSRGKGRGQKQAGPIIIDMNNELVYAHDATNGTNNFRMQETDAGSHLTYWQGKSVLGHGYGNVHILDNQYRETTVSLEASIDVHTGGTPGLIDFHEHQMTRKGSILVGVYNNTEWNLTSIGGDSDGWVADSMIYEIDTITEEVLFSWSALDHLPLESSRLPLKSYMGNGSKKSPWDHFHINSIQDLDEGYLISSRHTWSCYLISKSSGKVIWTLDGSGNQSDFGALSTDGQFRWQHDARAHNVTQGSMILSIFDNHSTKEDLGHGPTKGLVLEVPLPPDSSRSPKILRSIARDAIPQVDSQGSFQADLSNGNQLLGYGPLSLIQEFGPGREGTDLRWEGRFGYNFRSQSYRAFKSKWSATPADWDPSLAIEMDVPGCDKQGHDHCIRAYVSWNGATDVTAWSVYTGSYAKTKVLGRLGIKLVGKAHKKGFETAIDIPVPGKKVCLQLGAIQSDEEVRRSTMICPGSEGR